MPFEDDQVRSLVADDLVAQLRGQVERKPRDAHQPALGVAAAQRALEALTNGERQTFGETRCLPCALAEGEDGSAGLEKVLLS